MASVANSRAVVEVAKIDKPSDLVIADHDVVIVDVTVNDVGPTGSSRGGRGDALDHRAAVRIFDVVRVIANPGSSGEVPLEFTFGGWVFEGASDALIWPEFAAEVFEQSG